MCKVSVTCLGELGMAQASSVLHRGRWAPPVVFVFFPDLEGSPKKLPGVEICPSWGKRIAHIKAFNFLPAERKRTPQDRLWALCMHICREAHVCLWYVPASEPIYNNCTLQSGRAGLLLGVMAHWHFSQPVDMYNWILFFIPAPAVENKPLKPRIEVQSDAAVSAHICNLSQSQWEMWAGPSISTLMVGVRWQPYRSRY